MDKYKISFFLIHEEFVPEPVRTLKYLFLFVQIL